MYRNTFPVCTNHYIRTRTRVRSRKTEKPTKRKMQLKVQVNKEQKTVKKRGKHPLHPEWVWAKLTSFPLLFSVHAHTASPHHRFSPPRTPHSTIPVVLATYNHAPR